MSEELDKLIKKCSLFHKEKKYNEVIALLSESVLEKHNSYLLYWYCAFAMFNYAKNNALALKYYSRAIELNDQYAIAYNNRGVIYSHQGDRQKAIADYTSFIKIDKENALGYSNRGICYSEIEKFQNAIDDYEKALAINYDSYSFLESKLEEAKEGLLLQGVNKNKKEIKELRNKMEYNVGAILKYASEDNAKHVAHYTKLGVIKNIVEKKHEQKTEEVSIDAVSEVTKQINGLWYFNVIYMNDPEEGEILFEHFLNEKKIKECFENGKRANETSVYLGCFLSADENNSHEDDLVMWRTYGKDEMKNEAAGCCVVIKSDFFDSEEDNLKYRKMQLSIASSSDIDSKEIKQPQRLFKVIYLNKNKVRKGLSTKIEKELTNLRKNLVELIGLRDIKNRNNEEKKIIDRIIFEQLSKICYLFKSSDYEFENEIRVVEYVPLGSKKIKKFDLVSHENTSQPNHQPPSKLYIESNKDILPYVTKIYLGAKVPNHNHWSTYLDYEIRQREREYRGQLEDKDKKIKIEVIKSTCNFQ